MEDVLTNGVICASYLKEHRHGLVQFSTKFMNTLPKSTAGSQYFTHTEIKLNTKNAISFMAFKGLDDAC